MVVCAHAECDRDLDDPEYRRLRGTEADQPFCTEHDPLRDPEVSHEFSAVTA